MINKGHRGRPARRAELAAFLRAQRARLRPADVGLPEGTAPGRRRTPGLRREEVAQLSGVSVTWYTWLEQGRNITASAQVINALARALLLNQDQHRWLRDLAGLAAAAPETPVDDVLPRLQRLVDAATPNPACVYDVHFDYLAWNTSYARLRRDPGTFPRDRRNLLWMMFTHAETRARLLQWERVARAVLSHFRAAVGQRPDDPRFAEIVAGLAEASPEFREWWAEYPIGYFRPATIGIDHPQSGPITLEIYQLRLAEHPDLLVVMEVPASTDDLQRVASLLDRP